MAEFGDSLVIRILADSSAFQGELSDVLDRLDELQSRVERLAGTSSQLNRLSSAISSLQTPLQSIGRVMEQVQRQADALSRTVITLNVGPALNALSSLSAAIAAVQAQLAALSVPVGGGFPGIPSLPNIGNNGGVRMFAEGGPVDGPVGIDRVPAMLTAGEFVLNRDAVRQLGLPFLQQINDYPAGLHPASGSREAPPPETTSITTQFGGVTIQVQQPGELASVLDSLAMEEVHLRNRRG